MYVAHVRYACMEMGLAWPQAPCSFACATPVVHPSQDGPKAGIWLLTMPASWGSSWGSKLGRGVLLRPHAAAAVIMLQVQGSATTNTSCMQHLFDLL